MVPRCCRCRVPVDQPADWRTHLCDVCSADWDMEAECPDGQPHVLVPIGAASAKSGPLEGGPYEVCECRRCNVFSIGAPIANVIASIEAANARRDARERR